MLTGWGRENGPHHFLLRVVMWALSPEEKALRTAKAAELGEDEYRWAQCPPVPPPVLLDTHKAGCSPC